MRKLLLICILILTSFANNFACDFEFDIICGKKNVYQVGDELVVNVRVTFIHRCNLNIEDTKFQTKGMKVLGAKDWVEESTGVYTRQLKLKVTKTGKLQLIGTRSCEKDGGYGSLTLFCEIP